MKRILFDWCVRAGVALVLWAVPGCAAHEHVPARLPVADARSDPSFHAAKSRGGTFELAWRALGGKVPRNESFELEVFIYADQKPLAGAALAVSGWMPEHGHGLIVAPRVSESEPGRYLVTGLLLHMRGRWQLAFDIVRDGYSERVEFELEV